MTSGLQKNEPSNSTVLAAVCSSRVFLYLTFQSYAALIPILQREWAMSNAAAGSVVSAFQVGFLVSLVGLSALTDWVSAKKVFINSAAALAVSSFLFALFARSYATALLLRTLMGLAMGGTYTPVLKIISEAFSSTHRGRAMGYFIGAGSLGHALSLVATGWIAAAYGWKTAFLLTTVGPVVGFVIPAVYLRGMRERKSVPEGSRFKKEVLGNAPAMLLIGGYTAHTWELEGQRAWTPAFLMACFMAIGATREQALQGGAAFSSSMYIVGVVSTAIAGYFSDRWGRTAVIIAMMTVSTLCSFSFGWMIGSPIFWVMAIGLCYGFAVIAESPVYSSGLTELVSPDYLGAALGIRSLIGFAAGAVSPTVFGLILDMTNPPGITQAGFFPVWGWAFCSLGAAAAMGPLTMFMLRRMPESLKMAGGKK